MCSRVHKALAVFTASNPKGGGIAHLLGIFVLPVLVNVQVSWKNRLGTACVSWYLGNWSVVQECSRE